MKVRKLNEDGRKAFSEYLRDRKKGGHTEAPFYLLESEEYTVPLGAEGEVAEREFSSRLDMAGYLVGRLGREEFRRLGRDPGMYSWLALFYLDQLCPPGTKPRSLYRYVLHGSENFQTYYRHLVFGPCSLYVLHGEDARLLLSGSVSIHPDLAEQFASRLKAVTNTALMRVADRLYFDEGEGQPKRGATSRGRPGNMRRLAMDMLDQFGLTYDMYAMEAEEILELLPGEFDSWKKH